MAEKATTTKATATRAKTTAPAETEGTHLASPTEETKMREAATKPAAVKEAVRAGKKDPIAKFGDPDADPGELAIRRANFG